MHDAKKEGSLRRPKLTVRSHLFQINQKNKSKNKPIGNSAHARRQKGGVPEEAEIGRTPTPF